MMALLYLVGAFINPTFFGSADAFHALLRDASRYARHGGRHDLRHRQQGPRPVGRLDLRPDRRRLLASSSIPTYYDLGVGAGDRRSASCSAPSSAWSTACWSPFLRVPAFIATLTMLLIGRGIRPRPDRRPDRSSIRSRRASIRWFFQLGETNAWGFNNQIPIALVVVAVGAVVLGQDPLGLRDLRHRRQRAGGDLRRHPDALGAHPRLPPLLALRDRSPA